MQIDKILTALPSLKLCNLGKNPLDSSTFLPNGQSFNQLSTLVLNATSISWAALEACLLGIKQYVPRPYSMEVLMFHDVVDITLAVEGLMVCGILVQVGGTAFEHEQLQCC